MGRYGLLLLVLGCGKTSDTAPGSTTTTEADCSEPPGCVVAEELAAGLLSVRAIADDDVWIVGAYPDPDDGTGPVILNYDGAAWTRLDASAWPGSEVWWAWVTADEGVFVGNNGLILELDRGTGQLEAIPGPDSETTFFGVWGASTDDLWAVGMTEGGDGPPALWRRQGGTWAAFEDPKVGPGDAGTTYFKVHGLAADDLWIVGTGGLSMHWNGTSLTPVATDAETETSTAPLLTVDVGGERPYLVGGAGNGLILEYDGTDWLDKSPDFLPGLNGVCATADAAWAVGLYGSRASRGADGTWIADIDIGVGSTTYEDWHGCSISPSGNLWTVGGKIASRPLNAGVIAYQGVGSPPMVTLD